MILVVVVVVDVVYVTEGGGWWERKVGWLGQEGKERRGGWKGRSTCLWPPINRQSSKGACTAVLRSSIMLVCLPFLAYVTHARQCAFSKVAHAPPLHPCPCAAYANLDVSRPIYRSVAMRVLWRGFSTVCTASTMAV